MSAVPKNLLTPEQYLDRESAAEFKSEYFAGEMFAMAGGSPRHNRIALNLAAELRSALRGKGCRPFNSDLRVKIDATGLYTYPDVAVVCGEPEIESSQRCETLLNPTLIVEVLSDSTETYDRTTKFRHYQKIETFREYVLVSQHEARVERFVRQDDGGWSYFIHEGLEVAFAAVPATLTLAEIYLDVEFPPAGPLRS